MDSCDLDSVKFTPASSAGTRHLFVSHWKASLPSCQRLSISELLQATQHSAQQPLKNAPIIRSRKVGRMGIIQDTTLRFQLAELEVKPCVKIVVYVQTISSCQHLCATRLCNSVMIATG